MNSQIHLTHMRTMVREAGWHVPCEPCKDAGDKGCCKIANRQRCDHFELFDMEEEDMEEEKDDDSDLSSAITIMAQKDRTEEDVMEEEDENI